MLTADEVHVLDRQFETSSTAEILGWAWESFRHAGGDRDEFSRGGAGDDACGQNAMGCAFPVFTLDTGLLFPETVEFKSGLKISSAFRIESLEPDLTVEQQAAAQGPELWKRDPDLCCTMRKVFPLQNKLGDLDCWITGLRRQQSEPARPLACGGYTLEKRPGEIS